MNADDLIEQINERQEYLTKENKAYFEDVLVYVRLSFDKSEQETEEVLFEILEHILMAQEEGRSATDVFGANPKDYLHEIVGELPKMVTKKQSNLFMMVIFYFLASALSFYAIINIVIYFIFDMGDLYHTLHIGSAIVVALISILAAFLLLFTVMALIRWVCFRNIGKVREFLLYWLYGAVSVGIFLLILFLIPSFGQVVHVPLYIILIIGVVMYIAAWFTRKRV